MRIKFFIFSLIIFCSSCIVANPGTEKFSIGLGAFATDQNSNTRLDGDGSEIDFEKDLGLDSSGTFFRMDGYYRFNSKHRLDFSFYDLSRDSVIPIDRELMFGDSTYDVDTTLSSNFDTFIIKGGYTYTFMQRDRGYLGLSLGLYTADTKIKLSAPTQGSVETKGVTAILPVAGLRGEYAMTPKWTLRGNGEIFKYGIDDIDGSFTDVYAGIDYKLTEQLAIGLGYNKVLLKIDVDKTNFRGDLDWDYDGALLYFKYDIGSIK